MLAITRLTFREAIRRRLVLAVGVMGVLFLTLFATGFWFMNRNAKFGMVGERPEVMNFFLLTGLYVVNFLVVVLTVLASVDTVAGEIASGAMQTIVTKPVRREQVILGKWLGLAVMLAVFTAAMGAAMMGIVGVIGRYFPPNAFQGIGLMVLEGLVVLSLCMLGGTRLSSLANGVVVFMLWGLAFIAGWIEQIGTLTANGTLSSVGIIVSLLSPSEALWRRAAYLMQPPSVRQLGFGPFATGAAPSGAMVGYAVLYAGVLLAAAVAVFRRRDLQKS